MACCTCLNIFHANVSLDRASLKFVHRIPSTTSGIKYEITPFESAPRSRAASGRSSLRQSTLGSPFARALAPCVCVSLRSWCSPDSKKTYETSGYHTTTTPMDATTHERLARPPLSPHKRCDLPNLKIIIVLFLPSAGFTVFLSFRWRRVFEVQVLASWIQIQWWVRVWFGFGRPTWGSALWSTIARHAPRRPWGYLVFDFVFSESLKTAWKKISAS